MLEKIRNKADKILILFGAKFKNLNPNTLTILSFIFAILTLLTYYFSKTLHLYLIISALLVGLSGFFDALDGFIARLKKQDNKEGDFLDHVLDRYTDFILIGGLPLTGFCNWHFALFAFIGVLFASYAGTQAQALGLGRMYKGILSRADRILFLFIALILQFFLLDFKFLGLNVLEILAIIFIIFGNLTALQRFYLIWKNI